MKGTKKIRQIQQEQKDKIGQAVSFELKWSATTLSTLVSVKSKDTRSLPRFKVTHASLRETKWEKRKRKRKEESQSE